MRATVLVAVLCVGCGRGALEGPEALDFGDLGVGQAAALPLVLRNPGAGALMLTVAVEPATDFTVAARSVRVPAGSSATLSVIFTPTRLGRRAASLTVRGDGVAASAALSGRGTGPALFVDAAVGLPLVPRLPGVAAQASGRIWVRSVGNAPVKLAAPTADSDELCVGTFAAGVCQPWAPVSLAAGAALAVPFEVRPASAGARAWTVSFPSNDPLQPLARSTVRAQVEDFEPCQLAVPDSVILRGGEARLTVRHTGPGTCLLRDARAVSKQALGFVAPPRFPVRLTATAPLELALKADPLASGVVRLVPLGAAEVEVPVLAEPAAGACLALSTTQLDFGVVHLGCSSAARSVTLYDTCSTGSPLDVIGVSGGGVQAGTFLCTNPRGCPEFILGAPTSPGGRTVTVKYHPLDLGQDLGVVALRWRGLDLFVGLSGAGDVGNQRVDTFREDRWRTDLLLMLDASPSFVAKRPAVRAQLQFLLEGLVAARIDLVVSLAAAEGAPGAVAQRLADNTGATSFAVTDAAAIARVLAVFDTLPVGSETEACIGPAAQLVAQPGGAARPGASFAALCITDAQEQSPTPSASLSALQAIAPQVSWDPVTTRVGATCASESVDDGTHAALAAQANGSVVDLCASNWASFFIPSDVMPRTTYFLTDAPDPSFPIEVWIDGQLRPSSVAGVPVWSFDPIASAVTFAPNQLPSPGATTEIRYTVSCR